MSFDCAVRDIYDLPERRLEAAGLIDQYLERLTPVNDRGDYFLRNRMDVVLGAFCADQLVGVLTGRYDTTEQNPRDRLIIPHVVVAEPFEGNRIGTQLLKTVEVFARERGTKVFKLSPTSDTKGFYKKQDYAENPISGWYFKDIQLPS